MRAKGTSAPPNRSWGMSRSGIRLVAWSTLRASVETTSPMAIADQLVRIRSP
jgi:hypothetical protein